MGLTLRMTAAFVLCCALGACSLPRGAALQSEIVGVGQDETPEFAHYQVTRDLLPGIASWPAGKHASKKRNWIKGGRGASGPILAAGDIVKIAIWENGENKLLTTEGVPSANLQTMRVSSSGNLFVPYVGQVRVAGMSPDAARAKIEEMLTPLIPAAQVQLDSEPGQGNAVDLVSGVMRPGSVPMQDRSMTVLGLISQGGGVQPSIENPQLRLIRGSSVYEISMQRVLDEPSLDTGLRPGDKLIVEKDPRYFMALGASGREEIIPFPQDEVTALEAVTLAGGISDTRANPRGILILREYPSSAVRAESLGGPEHERVVFSIDLTSTDGLFSAQNFHVQPKDLVLATESSATSLRTILQLVGTSIGVANRLD